MNKYLFLAIIWIFINNTINGYYKEKKKSHRSILIKYENDSNKYNECRYIRRISLNDSEFIDINYSTYSTYKRKMNSVPLTYLDTSITSIDTFKIINGNWWIKYYGKYKLYFDRKKFSKGVIFKHYDKVDTEILSLLDSNVNISDIRPGYDGYKPYKKLNDFTYVFNVGYYSDDKLAYNEYISYFNPCIGITKYIYNGPDKCVFLINVNKNITRFMSRYCLSLK